MVSAERTLGVSIVDPHGDHLADTRPKLQALARYAEIYGDRYVRIESIANVDDRLRVLDLHEAAVRTEVLSFEGTQLAALYDGPIAHDYR